MQTGQIDLIAESPTDWWEVEALYDLCFAPGRSALSSYRLRDGVDPVSALCLTARDADHILAGAVRNWPVKIGAHDALLLGPIAVHPTRQGEGIAALLLTGCIAKARDMGWSRMMLVGDLPYYQRFGFARLTGVTMPPPTNPERVLGLALDAHGWHGVSGHVARLVD